MQKLRKCITFVISVLLLHFVREKLRILRYKSFVQIIIINLLVECYYQRSDSCVIVFQNQRFCYAKIRRDIDTFIEVFTHLEKFYADCNKFISRIQT